MGQRETGGQSWNDLGSIKFEKRRVIGCGIVVQDIRGVSKLTPKDNAAGFRLFPATGSLADSRNWTASGKNLPTLEPTDTGNVTVKTIGDSPAYLILGGSVSDFSELSENSGFEMPESRHVMVRSSFRGTKGVRRNIVINTFDESRSFLSQILLHPNRAARVTFPEEAAFYLFTIRLKGPGDTQVDSVALDHLTKSPHSNGLVIEYAEKSQAYPSDEVDELINKIMAAVKPSAPEIVKQVVPESPNPAADPKSRRTGAPAPKFTRPQLSSAREYDPIVGDEAKQWIDARTGGAPYQVSESVPEFNAGPLPFARDIPVAMIADDFTYYSFKDEFDVARLKPKTWREQFEKHKPQMFFCESAWQGGDPKEHPWQAKIYASVRWPKENRGTLLEILDYCHKQGIPTVFWNKEDPTHFGDRINDFIRTAALFDYVFTTAEECIPGYKKDVGVNHVDVLPFAVQPTIFNPQGIGQASDSVNFAGTWYGNYPERCAAASQIMDQVLDTDLDLVIYDRMYSSPNPVHKYPEKYRSFTRPAIPYEQTAVAYKQSKFGITLNTVTDSSTMFARRVFELAASGAVVLSNTARGVKSFFGDSVIYADEDVDRLQSMTHTEYRDLQDRAMNVALDNTYTHRAETVLSTVGIAFQPAAQMPTGLVTISTEAEYLTALSKLEESSDLEKLIIAVASDAEQSLEFRVGIRHDPNVVVVRGDSLSRGEVRIRSVLDTPGVVTLPLDGQWPTAEGIRTLQRHSSHFSGAITEAKGNENRFQTTMESVSPGTYLPAKLLGAAGADELEVPTFHVQGSNQ